MKQRLCCFRKNPSEAAVVHVAPTLSEAVDESWTVDEVAEWLLSTSIPGKEEIVEKLKIEEIDGECLLSYSDQQHIKTDLGITSGKATKLWKAIHTR